MLSLIFIAILQCTFTNNLHSMANRLINELSPYLLQHAHNPVDWYAWGDEPFEKAKQENKPVIVSIGYAACHWCHVMERESFEDATVAAYMNEHFVCIKVDREEHPDVDHLYIDAVQAISGSGGWPLNAFATPDRVPFYGGTYFPPRPMYSRMSWMQVLERMHTIWQQQQDEVQAQSKQMVQYLQNASKYATAANSEAWTKETCVAMTNTLLQQADTENGGFGRAPKFPGTMAISYLLHHFTLTGNEAAKTQALHSLDAMIAGGIYDQLGGGFARYATDEKWLVPHFEKMLYDNALLIMALCDAYALTKNKRYKEVIEETIAFAEAELKDATGGYYSAIDADSEGVEGKYYTFTWQDWQAVIGDDAMLQAYFGIEEEGNWEHTNILHVATGMAALATKFNLDEAAIADKILTAKQKLLATRNTRIRPLTDDKCLLSWNALMNIALSKAGAVLSNKSYLQAATKHMDWMHKHFWADGKWKHTWKAGKARIEANLDDYAYLIQAMLQLASASGQNDWITRANTLLNDASRMFIDENYCFFYYTSADRTDIPVRKIDNYDGATPSANAVMTHNMLLLGLCMERFELTEQAFALMQRMAGSVSRYTYSFAYWAGLMQQYAHGFKTIQCNKEDAAVLQQYLLSGAFIITSQKEISENAPKALKKSAFVNGILICTQDACLPPKQSPADVLAYLHLWE
ncbi:hypothetical protein CAP35_01805 [Chitinophagaceae bacterium IBVUCB1]|nr:hypothetical protein CAP35_01805 [Chitinophagaceae bacterium IBVUCB1]